MAANLDPTKPIESRGLFDSTAAGQSYDAWKSGGGTTPFASLAPSQVNDSVYTKATAYSQKDSPLMKAAQTEGLKIANRRGLLNSSMAADASQDAVLRQVMPMASQDASQDFQRNQAARAFEYGMVGQDRDIEFRTDLFDKDADLRKTLQSNELNFNSGQKALDRALQEKLAKWQLDSSDRNAAAQLLTNMEQLYSNQYASIFANTALDAATREQYMTSAKNLRDKQINFVEQLYGIDLVW
jgi:hypothetical protein